MVIKVSRTRQRRAIDMETVEIDEFGDRNQLCVFESSFRVSGKDMSQYLSAKSAIIKLSLEREIVTGL